MLSKIIRFSLNHKLIIILITGFAAIFGIFSLSRISIGAVPDITNNQVQVLTTSRNLSTQDIEQFVTYPVELEMANLPGVLEIRSVSKFGLSVVTIVFEDKMGTYLPRQLIAEKIKSASEKIPEGFGSPEMGPISTGLGEIYQYILDTKPGYKDRYTAMDLRTIQDWIVKRQLSGIPGVVEVNTWGGQLKQYEIAVNPQKLMSLNITISQLFTALEKNNSVAGGGYIERLNQAYFIRGEGLIGSLADVENIVVTNKGGIPILVKDLAKVRFGAATRFGAITGNGEGEKVLGQVMMLKNANSKEVIEAVKERVSEISNALPEGIYINDFLERSELIDKTTWTVTENLILGCLIVIFVVVLLLGNLRSGLVVASIIPLSLLFALSLMYLFGVDANLMSLGAIDFGIIIDGAVIIVEFTAFMITRSKDDLKPSSGRHNINEITFTSASKMMNSAIFGQFIILIVFIPILSLSGVEGKMFRPMALTFSFALIGAMILCVTYVPVVSALVLRPSNPEKENISQRFIKFLYRYYEPLLRWSLRKKRLVIGIAVLLLLGTIGIFSRMGAEFVPTLDEGDFVIQPVLKTGTSLSKTIEITTEIENILMRQFSEVDQVVTRIGAAEVPTDPMSMEESDVIITLKPKKEWTNASSKDELANLFKDALKVIPGMEVEFTQPIEMRFNELITGVRADIAIKVFGEDLAILNEKANEIKELIADIPGAADVVVEKTVGLPQMNVKYNRAKIAKYGLNIDDLNKVISMGFAGANLGQVYEGERRFDLTLRLDEEQRKGIENLQNLYIDLPNGNKAPLSELAAISYDVGAAKIARDNTKRRVVVGINVRNRDLQSVVDDIQLRLSQDLKLPPGYTLSYGGQFENLEMARNRLMVAVPISLVLIFILLFFAFNSAREALLVYSAIPLAAIGGVLLLWVRDMPFSISAGIGFIALFGIAVLNGIVLIEHFKELKKEGMTSIEELIIRGAKARLRAVLLTASAAALGFLPMAISTNVGAEVQRPLATVVIGGLITATLLTLVVLPVLYSIFMQKRGDTYKNHFKKFITILLLFMASGMELNAQTQGLSIQEIEVMALKYNSGIKFAEMKSDEAKAMMGTAFDFDKTEVYYSYDQNNISINGKPLEVYGLRQNFKFPSLYFAERKIRKSAYGLETTTLALKKRQLLGELNKAFYQLQYVRAKEAIYKNLDSLYEKFAIAAARKFELGETNYLETLTSMAKRLEWRSRLDQIEEEKNIARNQIIQMVQADETIAVRTQPLQKLELNPKGLDSHPGTEFFAYKSSWFRAQNQLDKQNLLPDINLEYFQGSNSKLNTNLYGYQLGLKVPLFFNGKASKIKASRLASEASLEEARDYEMRLKMRHETLLSELAKYEKVLSYYELQGNNLAKELLNTALKSYQNGEVDYFQYIQSLENASNIELGFLEALNRYNQTVISINHLTL